MRKWRDKILKTLRDPTYRPYEIWLVRALLTYVGAKLGIDFVKAVN